MRWGSRIGRFVQSLEAQRDNLSIKAIVCSGYANDPIIADYRSHGFVATIEKPYDLNRFAATVHRVLTGENS